MSLSETADALGRLRPPSAAGEDRNYVAVLGVALVGSAAPALRGGRGSQRVQP